MPRKDLGRPLLNDIQSSKKKIKQQARIPKKTWIRNIW